LVLNGIIYLFSAFERYPISIAFRQGKTNAKILLNLKKEGGFSGNFFMKIYETVIGWIEH